MRIQFLGGGLANQICQYIFVRHGERRAPQQEWLFDDSYFFGDSVVHNGYELEKVFGIQANLMSRYVGRDAWEKIIKLKKKGVSLPSLCLHSGIAMTVESKEKEGLFSEFTGNKILRKEFSPDIWNMPFRNIYYWDYWQEPYWFEQDQEENIKELTFPALTDVQNLTYAEQIRNSFSVGIHVRRGDFLEIGREVSPKNYQSACKRVLERFPNAWFFVFSDDLDWCKKHENDMGFDLPVHTIYVEGNTKERNYIDMQLMSLCQGLIRPVLSSFSLVAAWLDQNLEFEICLENASTIK